MKFWLERKKNYICTRNQLRALSSVGSEHLVYTQRVGGSNPSAPTKGSHKRLPFFSASNFSYCPAFCIFVSKCVFMKGLFLLFLAMGLIVFSLPAQKKVIENPVVGETGTDLLDI